MKRRAFIASLSIAVLAWSLSAWAQQPPGKVARIGYLGVSNATASAEVIEVTVQGFRDLGYVEGETFVMEYRWAEGRYERLPALAAELVRSGMDVIFAPTTNAALATRNVTTTIPIVIATVGDPVGSGLAASLARPGGNVTGLCLVPAPEIAAKRLELLKETIAPGSRIAVLRNPNSKEISRPMEAAKVAAESMGLQLLILEAQAPDDFDSAFQRMVGERANGLLVFADVVFWMHRKALAEHALENRLPSIFHSRDHAQAGGLMAYGPSILDVHRRAPIYVDRILRGAKPADLPIAQPTKYELVINLKTAKALGITIPESVLARADELIE